MIWPGRAGRWSGSPAMASDKIRTQAYTAVICIADRSVTALPEDEVPIKKEPPPDRFLGLSLDRNMLDIKPIFIPPMKK